MPDRADRSDALTVYVDVTDAVRTVWAAGLQRVVRQLLARLRHDDRITLVPMVWSHPLGGFRHVDRDELRALYDPPTPAGRPDPAVANTSRVRQAGVAAVETLGLKRPLEELRRRVGLRTVHRGLADRAIGALPSGAVLLEVDAVWNVVRVDREQLYAELRSRGIPVVALLYDLLPQEHPEWFEPQVVELSERVLRAVARHASAVLAISQHTASSFERWAERHGFAPVAPVVVTLGADAGPHRRSDDLPAPRAESDDPYLLVVGTVEPRKNHATLLDAYERVRTTHPQLGLVVVGRPGWRNDEVIDRLDRLAAADPGVRWLTSADDATLHDLYAGAYAVVVPSITEGYGLPVIEALAHGVPVVSSRGGALPEAGGELVDHVDALDVDGWIAAITRHLDDTEHHAARRAGASAFVAPTWAGTARAVGDVVLGARAGAPSTVPKVRVVVVNWNSAWYTRRCLAALLATDYPRDALEIVVVDNGSVDGSLEQLRFLFPEVRFVANDTNLGFAEGCNRALRDLAGVDHVALINNDTVVEPSWLTPLVDALERDATAGAAAAAMILEPRFAPMTLEQVGGTASIVSVDAAGVDVSDRCRISPDPDGGPTTLLVPLGAEGGTVRVQVTGAGEVVLHASSGTCRRRIGVEPVALEVEVAAGGATVELLNGLGTAFDEHRESYDLRFDEAASVLDHLGPAEVPGFCGGAVLLRRAMLDEVGVFDPRFFTYYEDTDLAWRARRLGWTIVAVPRAVVRHALGASGGARSPSFFHLNHRNWLLTVLRSAEPRVVRFVVRNAFARTKYAFVVDVLRPARAGRRPRWQVPIAWTRVLVGVAVAAPRVLWTRLRRSRFGQPTDRVRSVLQPPSRLPVPTPRPDGPLTVHLVLRPPPAASTDPAGRFVRRAVAEHPDVTVVPVVADGSGTLRWLDTREWAALLGVAHTSSGPGRFPPGAPTPSDPGRTVLLGVAPIDGEPAAIAVSESDLAADPEGCCDRVLGELRAR